LKIRKDRVASCLALLSLSLTTTPHAQEIPLNPSGSEAAAAEVVVTGSRIPNVGGQAPADVTIITSQDLEDRGFPARTTDLVMSNIANEWCAYRTWAVSKEGRRGELGGRREHEVCSDRNGGRPVLRDQASKRWCFAAGQALTLANPGCVHQHPARPSVDVVFLHRASHELHPLASLLSRHPEPSEDRLRGLGYVEGIYQQRLEQLTRCSRKRT